MKKADVLNKIREEKLIAYVKSETADKTKKSGKACIKGGIKILQIAADAEDAFGVINELVKECGDEILIGAGAVLDSITAHKAIEAGAKFIVTPCFIKEVVVLCNRLGVAVIPGVMTVRETVEALEYGLDLFNLYPSDSKKPSDIATMKVQLPQADFIPAGKVIVDDVGEWLRAGAAAIETGYHINEGAKDSRYEMVTMDAARFVGAVKFDAK